jgi:hypothetical protein
VDCRWRENLIIASNGWEWGRDRVIVRIVRRKGLGRKMLGRNVRLTGNRMLGRERLVLNTVP